MLRSTLTSVGGASAAASQQVSSSAGAAATPADATSGPAGTETGGGGSGHHRRLTSLSKWQAVAGNVGRTVVQSERARREAACGALLLRRFPCLASVSRTALATLLRTTRQRSYSSRNANAAGRQANVLVREGEHWPGAGPPTAEAGAGHGGAGAGAAAAAALGSGTTGGVGDAHQPQLLLIASGSVDVYMRSPFLDARRQRHPQILLSRLRAGDDINAFAVALKGVEQTEHEHVRKRITYEPSPYTLVVSPNSEFKDVEQRARSANSAGSQKLLVYTVSLLAFRNLLCSAPMLYEQVHEDVLSRLSFRRERLTRNALAHTSIGGYSADRTPFELLPSRALDVFPAEITDRGVPTDHGQDEQDQFLALVEQAELEAPTMATLAAAQLAPPPSALLRARSPVAQLPRSGPRAPVMQLHTGYTPSKFSARSLRTRHNPVGPAPDSALARILSAPPPLDKDAFDLTKPPAAFTFEAMMGRAAMAATSSTSSTSAEEKKQSALSPLRVGLDGLGGGAPGSPLSLGMSSPSLVGSAAYEQHQQSLDPMSLDNDELLLASGVHAPLTVPGAARGGARGSGGAGGSYQSEDALAMRRYQTKLRLAREQALRKARDIEEAKYLHDMQQAVARAQKKGLAVPDAPHNALLNFSMHRDATPPEPQQQEQQQHTQLEQQQPQQKNEEVPASPSLPSSQLHSRRPSHSSATGGNSNTGAGPTLAMPSAAGGSGNVSLSSASALQLRRSSTFQPAGSSLALALRKAALPLTPNSRNASRRPSRANSPRTAGGGVSGGGEQQQQPQSASTLATPMHSALHSVTPTPQATPPRTISPQLPPQHTSPSVAQHGRSQSLTPGPHGSSAAASSPRGSGSTRFFGAAATPSSSGKLPPRPSFSSTAPTINMMLSPGTGSAAGSAASSRRASGAAPAQLSAEAPGSSIWPNYPPPFPGPLRQQQLANNSSLVLPEEVAEEPAPGDNTADTVEAAHHKQVRGYPRTSSLSSFPDAAMDHTSLLDEENDAAAAAGADLNVADELLSSEGDESHDLLKEFEAEAASLVARSQARAAHRERLERKQASRQAKARISALRAEQAGETSAASASPSPTNKDASGAHHRSTSSHDAHHERGGSLMDANGLMMRRFSRSLNTQMFAPSMKGALTAAAAGGSSSGGGAVMQSMGVDMSASHLNEQLAAQALSHNRRARMRQSILVRVDEDAVAADTMGARRGQALSPEAFVAQQQAAAERQRAAAVAGDTTSTAASAPMRSTFLNHELAKQAARDARQRERREGRAPASSVQFSLETAAFLARESAAARASEEEPEPSAENTGTGLGAKAKDTSSSPSEVEITPELLEDLFHLGEFKAGGDPRRGGKRPGMFRATPSTGGPNLAAAGAVPLFVTPTRNSNGILLDNPDPRGLSYAEFFAGELNVPERSIAAAQALAAGVPGEEFLAEIARRVRGGVDARKVSNALTALSSGGAGTGDGNNVAASCSGTGTAKVERLLSDYVTPHGRVSVSPTKARRSTAAKAATEMATTPLERSPVNLLGFISAPTGGGSGDKPVSPHKHRLSFSFGSAMAPEFVKIAADSALPPAAATVPTAATPVVGTLLPVDEEKEERIGTPAELNDASPASATQKRKRPAKTLASAASMPVLPSSAATGPRPPRHAPVSPALARLGVTGLPLTKHQALTRGITPTAETQELIHSHSDATLAQTVSVAKKSAEEEKQNGQSLGKDATLAAATSTKVAPASAADSSSDPSRTHLSLNTLHPWTSAEWTRLRHRVRSVALEARQRQSITLSDIFHFQGLDDDPAAIQMSLGLEQTVGMRAAQCFDLRTVVSGLGSTPSTGLHALSIILQSFCKEHPVYGVRPPRFKLTTEMSGLAMQSKKQRARKKIRQEIRARSAKETNRSAARPLTAEIEGLTSDDDAEAGNQEALMPDRGHLLLHEPPEQQLQVRLEGMSLSPVQAGSATRSPAAAAGVHALSGLPRPSTTGMGRQVSFRALSDDSSGDDEAMMGKSARSSARHTHSATMARGDRRPSKLMQQSPSRSAVGSPLHTPLHPSSALRQRKDVSSRPHTSGSGADTVLLSPSLSAEPSAADMTAALTFLTLSDPSLIEAALTQFNFFGAPDTARLRELEQQQLPEDQGAEVGMDELQLHEQLQADQAEAERAERQAEADAAMLRDAAEAAAAEVHAVLLAASCPLPDIDESDLALPTELTDEEFAALLAEEAPPPPLDEEEEALIAAAIAEQEGEAEQQTLQPIPPAFYDDDYGYEDAAPPPQLMFQESLPMVVADDAVDASQPESLAAPAAMHDDSADIPLADEVAAASTKQAADDGADPADNDGSDAVAASEPSESLALDTSAPVGDAALAESVNDAPKDNGDTQVGPAALATAIPAAAPEAPADATVGSEEDGATAAQPEVDARMRDVTPRKSAVTASSEEEKEQLQSSSVDASILLPSALKKRTSMEPESSVLASSTQFRAPSVPSSFVAAPFVSNATKRQRQLEALQQREQARAKSAAEAERAQESLLQAHSIAVTTPIRAAPEEAKEADPHASAAASVASALLSTFDDALSSSAILVPRGQPRPADWRLCDEAIETRRPLLAPVKIKGSYRALDPGMDALEDAVPLTTVLSPTRAEIQRNQQLHPSPERRGHSAASSSRLGAPVTPSMMTGSSSFRGTEQHLGLPIPLSSAGSAAPSARSDRASSAIPSSRTSHDIAGMPSPATMSPGLSSRRPETAASPPTSSLGGSRLSTPLLAPLTPGSSSRSQATLSDRRGSGGVGLQSAASTGTISLLPSARPTTSGSVASVASSGGNDGTPLARTLAASASSPQLLQRSPVRNTAVPALSVPRLAPSRSSSQAQLARVQAAAAEFVAATDPHAAVALPDRRWNTSRVRVPSPKRAVSGGVRFDNGKFALQWNVADDLSSAGHLQRAAPFPGATKRFLRQP